MPHVIVEYTSNIKNKANIQELLQKINKTLMTEGDIFPIGGLRSRAIELNDYFIADGTEEDAFVHATFKIGPGRSDKVKKRIGAMLFSTIEDHFSSLFAQQYLALSLELYEFTPDSMYRKNNIHKRFQT